MLVYGDNPQFEKRPDRYNVVSRGGTFPVWCDSGTSHAEASGSVTLGAD